MSMYVVFQWSINPAEEATCDAQLEAITEHIRNDHPEIVATSLYKQWTGPQPRRGYTWMETYESLAKIDEGEITPACLEVWKPVEAMSQPGTWHASVWFDGPGGASLKR